MKKAIIDQMMLGLFVIVVFIVFGATVADEMELRNKYYNLKKVTDNVALAMAKYYNNVNPNTTEAEVVGNEILDSTKLGVEIKDDIVYVWDIVNEPNSITVSLPSYEHQTFWYRFFDKLSFNLSVSSKANIINSDKLEVVDQASDFVPFAINECGQDIIPGESYSFIYKPYDIYSYDESLGFYGLTYEEPDRLNGSQEGFAHFKNEVTTFNRIEDLAYLVDSDLSSVENDAQQLASELEVHKFNDLGESWNISIALLDCSSTKDDIVIANLIPVAVTKIYCDDKATPEPNITSAFEDQTGDVFTDVNWVEWVDSKDCSQSGLFRIDVTISYSKKVILEY